MLEAYFRGGGGGGVGGVSSTDGGKSVNTDISGNFRLVRLGNKKSLKH